MERKQIAKGDNYTAAYCKLLEVFSSLTFYHQASFHLTSLHPKFFYLFYKNSIYSAIKPGFPPLKIIPNTQINQSYNSAIISVFLFFVFSTSKCSVISRSIHKMDLDILVCFVSTSYLNKHKISTKQTKFPQNRHKEMQNRHKETASPYVCLWKFSLPSNQQFYFNS